jgi:protein TonB
VTYRFRFREWVFWLSLAISLAVHSGIAIHLSSGEAQNLGQVETPTAAISVNFEVTDIVDALEQSAATESAAGAVSPPAEVAPPEVEKPIPPEIEPEKPVAEPEPPVEPVDTKALREQAEREEERVREQIAEEALRRAVAAEAERRESEKRRELAEAEAEARRIEQRKQTERDERAKRSRLKAAAGASGSRGGKSSKGRVSASQGSRTNYAASVRARIARNKPQTPGAKGVVLVYFTLSASGGVIVARIASSSGNASLDRSALAAVRRSSPFPKPPPGSTPGQLVFTMPFYFR